MNNRPWSWALLLVLLAWCWVLGCCDAPSIGPVSPRIQTVNENVVRINGSEITSRQSVRVLRDGRLVIEIEGGDR